MKKLETITIVVVACFAVVVSVLDLAGALDGVIWLRSRITVLTLLVLGTITGYLIIERATAARAQEDILQRMVNKTIAGLSGIEVHKFDSVTAFWSYAADRIKTSHAIDDLTWGLPASSAIRARDAAAYAEYRRQIASAATGKGENRDKLYREIISFPNRTRIAWATELMKPRYPNYHLRFYDYDHTGTPRLLQFCVFDNIEVLVGLDSLAGSGSASDSHYVTFRSAELAEMFSKYFDVAWREAIPLKDTHNISRERLQAIADQLAEP